jgi:hypothetical protein
LEDTLEPPSLEMSLLKSPSGRCRAKRPGVEVPENEIPRKCAKNEVSV